MISKLLPKLLGSVAATVLFIAAAGAADTVTKDDCSKLNISPVGK